MFFVRYIRRSHCNNFYDHTYWLIQMILYFIQMELALPVLEQPLLLPPSLHHLLYSYDLDQIEKQGR